MNAKGWSAAFGELARQTMLSPELERYFSIPITRAQSATDSLAAFALRPAPQRLLGLCVGQLPAAAGEAKNSRP